MMHHVPSEAICSRLAQLLAMTDAVPPDPGARPGPGILGAAVRCLLATLWLLPVAACIPASKPLLEPPAHEPWVLGWVTPGETTRAELRERYGPPSISLEDGRIWAYDLLLVSNDWLVGPQPRLGANVQLLLTFDALDRVARHRLRGVGYRRYR